MLVGNGTTLACLNDAGPVSSFHNEMSLTDLSSISAWLLVRYTAPVRCLQWPSMLCCDVFGLSLPLALSLLMNNVPSANFG